MKTYQKPVMIALSLTGNEQLCGSCSEKLKDPETNLIWTTQYPVLDLDNDGTIEQSELVGLFGQTENCAYRPSGFEAYCKFTSANVIAWS